MTTVSSTSMLKTLMALYQNENGASGGSSRLTTDQVGTIEGMLNGTSANSAGSNTTDDLPGASTTDLTDLGSIIDAINAKAAGATSGSTTDTATATPQQKAATMMQSLYQTQQNNLFTLIG